ncbi:MAG: hypothetical protein JWM78_2280 [Verrucomicrobiaceae bacterium]|nr:hypothetical protein [Verrucomicrobiaceae bacterium]
MLSSTSRRQKLFRLSGLVIVIAALQSIFAAADSRGIEEVSVTARRSVESAQSVPVVVSAFSAETLREAGVIETRDLMFSVPGFYAQGGGSKENAVYSIRGQGRSVAGTGQPGVVTYFAEVPLAVFGSSVPQYDMDNIQVLKGPQGTLFGRNTTGGAVLLYPKTPSYELGGYLKGGVGNYNFRDVEGAVNTPIIADKVALRLAGRISRRDGYTKNIGSGGDLDDLHSDSFRASLLIEPTDWVKNTLIYDWHRTREAGQGQVLAEITPFAALYGIDTLLNQRFSEQEARGPRKVDYGAFKPRSDLDQWGVFNRLEIDLGNDVQLVNVSGYRKYTWIYDANTDALPDPVGLLDALNTYSAKQYSTELQLRGKAFADNVDWLLGGFYLKSKPDGFYGSTFNQFFAEDGRFAYMYSEEESRAVFVNTQIKLDQFVHGLAFNAGYRYTWDKYEACTGSGFTAEPIVTPSACAATNPNFQPGTAAELKTDSSAGTWTIGFDWQINDNLFSYITARHGYRGGGLNLPALGPRLVDQQTYNPEKVTDVEIGIRSDWNIGGWQTRMNASVFELKAKKTQLSMTGITTQPGCVPGDAVFGQIPYSPDGDCNPANDPASTTLLVNAGDSTLKGLDLELSVAPMTSLTLGATASLMDHKTDKFEIPANVAFYAGTTDKLPFDFSPKKSATAYARQEFQLPQKLGELVFRADYYWTGKVDMLAYHAAPYGMTNVRLDWNDVGGERFDIGLYARNVFDKEAVVAGALNPAGVPAITVLYNEPRMYGLELRYRFGG